MNVGRFGEASISLNKKRKPAKCTSIFEEQQQRDFRPQDSKEAVDQNSA
jgi:hypothetical protein